jgi:hypothetical protein
MKETHCLGSAASIAGIARISSCAHVSEGVYE